MTSSKFAKSAYCIVAITFQLTVLGLLLASDVNAQYEYDNSEGPSVQSSRKGNLAAWDNVNQAILEKCIQMQTMTLKKRNFGLEIPDIIMNRVQGGTEGSTNLKELRTRMLANGK
ncbi:hypothetical protein CHUAL_006606 [Chamberlinius hualienensis]